MSVLKKYLTDNGLTPSDKASGSVQETDQQKLDREKLEREQQGQQQDGGDETETEKLEREKKEKEQKSGIEGQQPATPAEGNAVDDEAVIKYLASKGKVFTSLDEIGAQVAPPAQLTDAEKEQQEQQRRDNIRKFALSNKKVTSTLFDEYARESTMKPVDIAFNLFKAEKIAELTAAKTPADEIPSDKEIRDEFDETHFQFAEPTDAKRIRHEKILQSIADNYLNEKYSSILDLEEEYDSHNTTQEVRKTYNTTVDAAIADIGDVMTFNITNDKGEKFPVTYKITPDMKESIRKVFTSDGSFNAFGKDAKKDKLTTALKNTLIQSDFEKIISEAATAYASSLIETSAKGRRGIPPARKDGEGSESGEKRTNKTVTGLFNLPENKKALG